MPKRIKLFYYIGSINIAYTCLPLLANLITLPSWVLSVVTSIAVVLLFPDILREKAFYWFLGYVLVTAIYVGLGRSVKLDLGTGNTLYQLLIEYAFMLPNILMGIVLIKYGDRNLVTFFFKITIGILFVSYALILPMLQQTDLRTLSQLEDDELQSNNILGYTILHAYTLIVPAISYVLLSTWGKERLVYMLFLIILLYVIIKSSITTSIIVMVLSLLATIIFIPSQSAGSALIATIVLFSFVFLYLSGVLIGVLDWIEPFFENTAVQEKIDDFRLTLTVGRDQSGTISVRQDLHEKSWICFSNNFLFGGTSIGGHSCILDRLASLGLIGFIPYFMLFYTMIRMSVEKMFVRKAMIFYMIGICVAIFMLYNKGLFGSEGYLFLFFIMPLMILFGQNNLIQNNNIKMR